MSPQAEHTVRWEQTGLLWVSVKPVHKYMTDPGVLVLHTAIKILCAWNKVLEKCVGKTMRRNWKGDINSFYTFSKGNLFFPIEDRVSLCDPTMTKLLVRTALGPPGLAKTTHRKMRSLIPHIRAHQFYTSTVVYLSYGVMSKQWKQRSFSSLREQPQLWLGDYNHIYHDSVSAGFNKFHLWFCKNFWDIFSQVQE